MMDAIANVVKVLKASAGVQALCTSGGNVNVFGGTMPEHYDPSSVTGTSSSTNGPAMVVTVRGGSAHAEMPLATVSVQVSCWAGINDFIKARAVYNAAFDALQGFQGTFLDGAVVSCLAETIGQDMVDPDTGWCQVVGHFAVLASENPAGVPTVISSGQTLDQYVAGLIAAEDLVEFAGDDGTF